MTTLHYITANAGLTLYRCYCVTHTALLLKHDSYYITVTTWLVYSIALLIWLILHYC